VAQGMNLKPFYWGLGVVALGGGAWIWTSMNRGGVEMYAEPLAVSETSGAASFPGYVKGSDAALVEVNEYADFQCPACALFWTLTFHDIEERLIRTGQVRWRFHDRPIDGSHRFARMAAHAAACGDEQGAFWPMHDQLFANQAAWSAERNPERTFRGYARAVGLDVARYDDCMQTGRFRARIQAEAEAADNLGITSTPTFVIGRMRISGAQPYDQFKRLIDSLSAKAAPSR